MKKIIISHSNGVVEGLVDLPASKSITNRVKIIRALTKKYFDIKGQSEAQDVLNLDENLSLIKSVHTSNKMVTLDVGPAGTNMRFLTSLLSITKGEYRLTGSDRMCQRPIGVLVDALKKLGADISYENKIGYPPLLIKGKNLCGGILEIDASVSSQFISSLMMIGPLLSKGLTIMMKGEVVSMSYINMTALLMKQFGVEVCVKENMISVPNGEYVYHTDYLVEKDWSAASYWFEIAALSKETNVLLKGLKPSDMQGDSVVMHLYKQFGVETTITNDGINICKKEDLVLANNFEYDFIACPDIAQTLMVTVSTLQQKGVFFGLNTLRIKETDRISAMQNELKKNNIDCVVYDNSVIITPSTIKVNSPIDTYHDHRMAMCFAPLALMVDRVIINDPDVIIKSYPSFWSDMEKVGFNCKVL